jgi:hypothetical protein
LVLSCTPFGRRLYAVGLFRHEPNPAGAPVRLNGLRRTDIAHHLAERFENTP